MGELHRLKDRERWVLSTQSMMSPWTVAIAKVSPSTLVLRPGPTHTLKQQRSASRTCQGKAQKPGWCSELAPGKAMRNREARRPALTSPFTGVQPAETQGTRAQADLTNQPWVGFVGAGAQSNLLC